MLYLFFTRTIKNNAIFIYLFIFLTANDQVKLFNPKKEKSANQY